MQYFSFMLLFWWTVLFARKKLKGPKSNNKWADLVLLSADVAGWVILLKNALCNACQQQLLHI